MQQRTVVIPAGQPPKRTCSMQRVIALPKSENFNHVQRSRYCRKVKASERTVASTPKACWLPRTRLYPPILLAAAHGSTNAAVHAPSTSASSGQKFHSERLHAWQLPARPQTTRLRPKATRQQTHGDPWPPETPLGPATDSTQVSNEL